MLQDFQSSKFNDLEWEAVNRERETFFQPQLLVDDLCLHLFSNMFSCFSLASTATLPQSNNLVTQNPCSVFGTVDVNGGVGQ
jgi:hypothetical protein